jgi:SAM-dependent methyltransferase
MMARARLIAAYVDYLGVPVRSILDAGCGVGLLRKPLLRLLPRAEYLGLEYSPYLCERYGWHCGSLAKFRPRHPFDLVICYDVGQYLDELTARQALTNLARLCRGVLYFTALTTTDWQHNCDRSRTDGNVHLRSRAWYDRRLQKHFRRAGVGFWIRRSAPITAWDMEAD